MKRTVLILLALLVLGGIVIGSIRAGGSGKRTSVYAETAARRKLLQIVKASGQINPRVQVNISAHVVAKIERLFVKEGDQIAKGQPFLRLEQQDFIADRDQWAAQMSSAQTTVREEEVAHADAEIKLHRAERLKAEGIMTMEQLEGAQLAERSALLKVEEGKQAINQMRANLVRAETDLAKTTIYAPISGRVIALNAKEGEVVVSGTMNNPASVIGTIADLSEVLAEVDVDETEIVNIRLGQQGKVQVDALPDHTYHGHVTEVGNSGYSRPSQPDVTFFKVKLLLSDSDQNLRANMSVRAEIETQERPNALTVPIQAVVERQPLKEAGATAAAGKGAVPASSPGGASPRGNAAQTGGEKAGAGAPRQAAAASGKSGPEPAGGAKDEVKVVFVVGADGKARQRPVRTGISDDTHVEVLAGLTGGEQVVTGPYRTLRDLKDGELVTPGKAPDEKTSAGAGAAGNQESK